MFLFLPLGHDRTVYSYPWVTFLLVGICTLIHAGGWVVQRDAEERLEAAAARAERVIQQHPEARIHWQPADLPQELVGAFFGRVFEPNAARSHPGDAELDAAMHDFLDAIWDMPAQRFGYRPGRPRGYTALTSMFSHGDFLHLFGNMIFLFLSGSVIEYFWRRGPYLVLYLGGGFLATIAHHISAPTSMAPLVGASGAISALLGAFVVGHPKTSVRIGYFVFYLVGATRGVLQLPAWFCIPTWAAFQFFGASAGQSTGTAYWCHIGGFVVGILAALVMKYMGWVLPEEEETEWVPDPAYASTPAPAFASVPPPATTRRYVEPIDLTTSSDELPTL